MDMKMFSLAYATMEDKPIGYMRYNLIFDFVPFLTCFYVADPHKGKGFGKQAMMHWEDEMRALGYKMIMVSTQVDEDAQHFYRKLDKVHY